MRAGILVFVCLLGVSFASGCCNASQKRDEAYARACAANMRVMTGAIELYNMDHSEMLKDVDFSMFQDGGLMMKSGVLKQPIQLPTDKCSYSFTGNFAEVDAGVISCAAHGTIKEIDDKYPRK
ncbi:MAG: hypothetical protein CVV41_08195 [Candidatus Riflebacteria bacterium HGW-Riflebacteria-1]|jgi:hypothetical protein|nr:MAG: hypothetical protein CVV41_08195 [Candidatus Riflebacteria bacterium HGW-Riflebacteria-1]